MLLANPFELTPPLRIFTIFMGIEPFIVTKDVCGLDNEKSIELLRWGVKLMYEGFINSKENE